MNWTTPRRSPQANFMQKLKILSMTKIQQLSKLAVSGFLALLISMTGIIIPGIALTNRGIAEAGTISQVASFPRKKILTNLIKAGSFISSASSFIPDLSVFRATLAPTFSPTLAPTFAPSLSLARIDFFFDFKEISLVKVINNPSNRPSEAQEYYKQGVNKAQKRDYKGAVRDLSDALSQDGNFAEAYVSRGRAYSELGEQQGKIEYQNRAIADYTKALEVTPKFAEDTDRYVEPLLARGAVYIKLGNYQSAQDDFNLAIKRNPDFYETYLSRATIYLGETDYQKAIEDLNLALYLNLDSPVAFLRRGSIRGELGEYEKAIYDFNEVIESKAEDASIYYTDAYYKQGLAYLNLGETQKAIDDFNQAINRDSNYAEAYYHRGIAYSLLREDNRAIEDQDKALTLNSEYREAYYLRGLSYLKLGKAQEAIGDLTETVKRGLNYPEVYYKLGEAYSYVRDQQAAIDNYTQAIQLNPDYPEAYVERGISHYFAGDNSTAIQDYNSAIQLNPKYAEAYFWYGMSLYDLDDYEGAIQQYNQAIKINPSALFYLWQGKAFYHLKKYTEGVGNFKEALLINPEYKEEIDTFIQKEIFSVAYTAAHSGYTESFAFNPDKQIIATGSCDKTIKLWDWKTGEKIRILEGHQNCVRAVAFIAFLGVMRYTAHCYSIRPEEKRKLDCTS